MEKFKSDFSIGNTCNGMKKQDFVTTNHYKMLL
jgi:hypothetical protein